MASKFETGAHADSVFSGDYSIGRAVAKDWAEDFVTAFNESPIDFGLDMKLMPGVMYAPGERIAALGSEHKRELQSKRRAQAHLSKLVNLCCESGALAMPEAIEPVRVEIGDLLISRSRGRANIVAMVTDIPQPNYPDGYLLGGERQAVLQTLGLGDKSFADHSVQGSCKRIGIGVLQGSAKNVDPSLLQPLKPLLAPRVELSSIGLIQE